MTDGEKLSSTPFDITGVLAIASGHLLHDTFSAFLFPMLPLLIDKLGLSLTMVGFLVMLLQIPSLFQPWFGYLSDRIDMRFFIVLAPVLTAATMSLLGLAPSVWVLALMVMFVGISSAAFHAPAPAVVTKFAGSRLGLGLSIFQMGGELGRTLGPLLIVAAISWWTLEGTYRLAVLGVAAGLILFLRLRRMTLTRTGARQTTSFWASLQAMRPILLPLALIILARSFIMSALTTYLPTFIERRGASLWLAGASLSIYEAAGVLGVFLAGGMSDRFGRRPILLTALVVTPILLLIFQAVEGWLTFPLLILMGLTSLATLPVLMAMVQEWFPAIRATANGVYMAVSFVGGATANLALGAMGDFLGLQQAFVISALLGFLGIPCVFWLIGRGSMIQGTLSVSLEGGSK